MTAIIDPNKPLTESIFNEDIPEEVKPPKYSNDERDYLGRMQKRLEQAKLIHNEPRREFDNLTLAQYYWENEKGANTMLRPKKNRADVTYQSGTLEDKMMALLSAVQGLNLSPDISAFDKQDLEVSALGNGMEDIIFKTEELDQDEEKQMIRQYELLKQGTIFTEEVWENKWEVEKKITSEFKGDIESAKWTTKRIKDNRGMARRNFLPITSVYLGDITQYFIEKQPYIFTLQEMSYEEAQQLYGGWERFKHVSQVKRSFEGIEGERMADNAWTLGEFQKGRVEVLKYQDKPNLEYQIILNGVPMLPMGYPFPWGYSEYSISQQNLRPFRRDFAYGKSFIFKNKNIARLLDEMMKLGLLKTQKSFMPAYINTSGRVITSRALMPGKINMHIGQGQLIPLSDKESEGVTNSEFAMIQDLGRQLDRKTVSQTFTGSQEGGGKVTATQIVELQRQARIMMGIVILSMSLMEKKLTMLRLMNILKNWFSPTGSTVDTVKNILKNKHRLVMREHMTDKGQGFRITATIEDKPTVDALRSEEDRLEGVFGKPVRIIALIPKEIEEAKYTWVINIHPKEKRSSELDKVVFQEMVIGGANMGLQFNPEFLKQEYADLWDRDAQKMFLPGVVPQQEVGAIQGGAVSKPQTKPQVKPSPNSNSI